MVLHRVTDFVGEGFAVPDLLPGYYYEGVCPQTGVLLRLPRTALVESVARGLMADLAVDEGYAQKGKMFGVLLVELPSGEQRVLKAFSGLLNGCNLVEGWVPPIPGRESVVVDETETLVMLDAIKQELIRLRELPERLEYENLAREWEVTLQQMSVVHSDRKSQRSQERQAFAEDITVLTRLDYESRKDGTERRLLKRKIRGVLEPLELVIKAADARIQELKSQRRQLSRQLQVKMHAAYSVMNFYGMSQSLQKFMPHGLPTGTGDCCAPKLLNYAASNGFKPLAMAEFWWGAGTFTGKVSGEFYGACVERCQPMMGFLLSGLNEGRSQEAEGSHDEQIFSPVKNVRDFSTTPYSLLPTHLQVRKLEIAEISVIYEDEWLMVVNKPAGLLSVPGRYYDTQDSVVSRLQNVLPDGNKIASVHRLDGETSGILLLAKDTQTHRQLSGQFQGRKVKKVYEALLSGLLSSDRGTVELPLWGNPENRPYQQVNWEYGKPSVTNFEVIKREGNYTRINFYPLTGRTHQLRVHAADKAGLNIPILGDSLYGCDDGRRLHLHAKELCFGHPQSGENLCLQVETPF
ncbi:RluA family pseudouridine synthase [Calothrix sp. PCC 6303]|uniref:RluA family pseudouridine synthase n=1 Tax=Calothrix sp. PCC 6303 TaxID=1170562 RepID=UPI0002A027F0|nr:RluA family pseudouridine synthase [Calothrix sp. PCC 6303]AFZ00911.1 pseudouridine synthase [Calothrix sp. PCC 6303]